MSDSHINSTNRIMWLDIARAISLFFVMAAHTFGGKPLVVASSFAVHLFFIFSGITGHFASSVRDIPRILAKLAGKLLLPPLVTCVSADIFSLNACSIKDGSGLYELNILHPLRFALTLIYSRCDDVTLMGNTIPGIGILWFFATLFSALLIYNLLSALLKDKIIIGVIISSLLGFMLSQMHIVLPLGIDIALTIEPYIYLGFLTGRLLKGDEAIKNMFPKLSRCSSKKEAFLSKPLLKFIIFILSYAVLFIICHKLTGNYFELSRAVYPLYPLCLMMATAGTYALSFFSMLIEHHPKIAVPLAVTGRNTLYLYCIHSADSLWTNLWNITGSMVVNYILRVVIDLAAMCVCIYISKMFAKSSEKKVS